MSNMSNMNNTSVVKEQYKDDKNLSVRLSLHQKYSTNKYGYFNWLFDFYNFFEGCSVLELGCGNGAIWDSRIDRLPSGSKLTLSDLSNGMLEIVREKFKAYPNVSTELVDIQDIQYADNTFDIIIANSMLYHVPNLEKAISEVYRVLKPGGKFYTTTVGVKGMQEYLHIKFKEFNPKINAFSKTFSFNLKNGKEILSESFNNIEMFEYEDSLEVTETSDLVDWIKSSMLMSRIDESELNGLDTFFDKCKDERGIIKIPKEAGIFIATK